MVLFKIDKNLKISLDNALLLFRLTINLGMKSSKKLLFNAKKIAKLYSKLRNKYQASIGNN